MKIDVQIIRQTEYFTKFYHLISNIRIQIQFQGAFKALSHVITVGKSIITKRIKYKNIEFYK